MAIRKARFNLYRYQLLPKDRYFQGDLYGIQSIDELLKKKNEILGVVLDIESFLRPQRSEIVYKVLHKQDDFYLFQIAANRSINNETKDFQTKTIDHWPRIIVAVWNAPDKQIVAIQKRHDAFPDTTVIMRYFESSVNLMLKKNNLTIKWEPLFETRVFWDIVKENHGRIEEIEFELITPNMANISSSLSENLKDFAKLTNSVKNRVSIQSDAASSLQIDQSNESITGLVDYSSEGGGNIAVKVKGIQKRIHTSSSIREIQLEEISMQGSVEEISSLLKGLMK